MLSGQTIITTDASLRVIKDLERQSERKRILEEVKQYIENGVIKIETGSDKLFEILDGKGEIETCKV